MLEDTGLATLKALAALTIVVALMVLSSAAFRRFSGFGEGMRVAALKKRRLSISEMRPIDHRSKLVLIRRDDVEHLILLTQHGTSVIESGIKAPSHLGAEQGASSVGDDPSQSDTITNKSAIQRTAAQQDTPQ